MGRRQSPPRPPRPALPPFPLCPQSSRSGHPCGRRAGHGDFHVCVCEAEQAIELLSARRGTSRDGQPTDNREKSVSNPHDTYEQALVAVLAALDGLYDARAKATTAFHPDADDYDPLAHHRAYGTAHGVADALAVVTGMLDDYRKAIA